MNSNRIFSDDELEQGAKEHPKTLFPVHVGANALLKSEMKLKRMYLDSVEMDAARGMHLAVALDEYADMHHIGRLVGVPSRKETVRNMNKGEAFWRGFQIARGEVVLKDGFRAQSQMKIGYIPGCTQNL